MLIIRSLAGSDAPLENISESDDTKLLQKALHEDTSTKDTGHAGTAMRFLTALFATRTKQVMLTGSRRMKERPIGPLVNALRQLGATIEYLEKDGNPPLKISGAGTRGGTIDIEGGVSSQFISALMMVGPVLEGGLTINLTGELVSVPYISMTRELMKQCGVRTSFNGNRIVVPQQSYTLEQYSVESDWSAASYWYQVAALLPGSAITLPNLNKESLQGDAILVKLFEPLGVRSNFSEKGVTLVSRKVKFPEIVEYDFSGCPDLVQTCAVTLCALDIPFRFTGTRTLMVKETDRIAALQSELHKLGFGLDSGSNGKWISWDGIRHEPEANPVIQTYHDHRMAMSFAPLAIKLGKIAIKDPRVVTKSYPGYWKDLENAGFRSPFCTLSSGDSCD